MPGLLINGEELLVPGVNIVAPDDVDGVRLNLSGRFHDGEPRPPGYVAQQWVLHKVWAEHLEKILPGAGPAALAGNAKASAQAWSKDSRCSGVQAIVGFDGTTLCLADIARTAAYHDTNYESNKRAVGVELEELIDGSVYQATLDAGLAITLAGCRGLGIQWQCPRSYVDNTPLARFADGGRDMVGIFGHRDVSSSRNRFDPGDYIFHVLKQNGVEAWDFAGGEDLKVWQVRQRWLRELGVYHGAIDGIPGAGTTKALRELGYPDGIFALWRTCAERPPMPPV
jgi:hypothetical protein